MRYLVIANNEIYATSFNTFSFAKSIAKDLIGQGKTVEIVAVNSNGCHCRAWLPNADNTEWIDNPNSNHVS